MDRAPKEKLARALAAYRRRFPMQSDDEQVQARMGGGGFAYISNLTTGHAARYDVAGRRVRFVEVTAKARR